MSLNDTGFRPLIRERGKEPFAIKNRDWNVLVEFFKRNLNLVCPGNSREPKVPHPWMLDVQWDYALAAWSFSVRPGFVRGHDVYMTTRADLASVQTLERLGIQITPGNKSSLMVEAPLTESPKMLIPAERWRPVATGSPSFRGSRAVPPSLQEQYNIVKSEVIEASLADLESGLSVDASETLEQDRETARVLYSIDIALRQPRATATLGAAQAGVDPNYLELGVDYADPTDDPPYVVLTRDSPLELEAAQSLSVQDVLETVDPGYDSIPLATIWMMGPAGELYADSVDETWQPVVEYHTFYNLDYTLNVLVRNLPPLRTLNPAAGLIGGSAVQVAVEIMNQYNRQAENLYRQVLIHGKFWTV